MFGKSDKPNLEFSTRSEAFNYALNYLVNSEKEDPITASEKADKFADLVAKNNGLPDRIVPEPKGIDKYISMAEKIGSYLEAHPKVLDYGIPALTFIAGLFTANKVEQHNEEYHSIRERFDDPIRSDEVED